MPTCASLCSQNLVFLYHSWVTVEDFGFQNCKRIATENTRASPYKTKKQQKENLEVNL